MLLEGDPQNQYRLGCSRQKSSDAPEGPSKLYTSHQAKYQKQASMQHLVQDYRPMQDQ